MFFNNLTPVVKNLIILNVGLFFIQVLSNDYITVLLSLHDPRVSAFKPFQVFTHMFLHGGIMHLFFNMLWLVFMGPMIERMFGDKKFLFFYIFTGLGAAGLYLASQYYLSSSIGYSMIGASGAISGVMMATAYYFPNSEILLFPIPIPIKLKYFVIGYAAWELFKGFNPNLGTDNVAHFAHLGGILFGYILIKFWELTR